MKIDILFFNEEFANREEFIADLDSFNEYITTHRFDAKSKDILLMPPSLSHRGNETILVAYQNLSQRELMELGHSIGKKIKVVKAIVNELGLTNVKAENEYT